MIPFNDNYNLENQKHSHQPVYVFEILWANGLHGTEGENDIYFGTTGIENIVNFTYPERYYPVLDADSISSISSKVDPISGVSSIGNLTVNIQDFDDIVSDIIQAADVAGHGLRRQRVEVYMLYQSMDWADKIKIRTMQVQDLRLTKAGKYVLNCSDIQRNLQKTVFNPYKSTISANIAAAGAITVVVPDNSIFEMVANVSYGTSGFVKVNDEIMRYTSKTSTTDLDVPAGGRGMFGTSAAAHTAGDEMQEIIVMEENPVTMALKVMVSSGVPGANGTYDVYPKHWGCGLSPTEAVEQDKWLQFGKDVAGLADTPAVDDGYQFQFVFDKGIEAKKFIESEILKILGGFGFPTGNGTYSVKGYNDLANTDKANADLHITVNNAVNWGDLQYDYTSMANELWLEYVESPVLSGDYIRTAIFNDEVSKKKWGTAKQLRYKVRGAIGTAAYVSAMYQRFQRFMARFSRPPQNITVELLPMYHGLEIGDVVRNDLPIRDLLTGADLDRAFEVLSVNLVPKTGAVSIECIAQPEKAAFWYNGVGDVATVTVSPATSSIANGATQQMTAKAYDANGNQVAWPSIVWTASGDGTIDAAGLVTATGVGSIDVYATIGGVNSNTASISVTAAPGAGTVASVIVSPASAGLEVGDTQLFVAQCFDSSGVEINGRTFTWASDDASVTIPAGPSVSATGTAASNGQAKITATETVSAIASSDVVVDVAALPPPEFAPPTIADAVYQVGTQLDETDSRISGPPGGPYTFDDAGDFAEGDYWFDADVSVPVGNTITINGNVRFFSQGDFTVNGTIDGSGRGLPGGAGGSGNDYSAHLNVQWQIGFGNVGTSGGLTGAGGQSGGHGFQGRALVWPSLGGIPTNATPPTIEIIPILPADGSVPWTQVAGITVNMKGCGGAGGPSIGSPTNLAVGGVGGKGGAGLLIMARGIFITGSGLVDLTGQDGQTGSTSGYYSGAAGGGGGGGGSAIFLAERTATGLTNMVVDANRIDTLGGNKGTNIGWYAPYESTAGGPGAFKSQVIG